MPKVCIVIPAYNESAVIYKVITDIDRLLSKSSFSYHIVVVDDGSKDSTAKEARRAGAHVIRHLVNTGSGGSTATGLSYAYRKRFDIAATIDADGQHNPKDLIKGLKLMNHKNNQCDLLIGSRLIKTNNMSYLKFVGNRGLSFMTFLLFGVKVTDSQSGLRIFSSKALDSLKWKSSGYEFCSEMLWRAKQQKLIIKEYPIKAIYTDYSKAKGQSNWNAYNIVLYLLKRRLIELVNE